MQKKTGCFPDNQYIIMVRILNLDKLATFEADHHSIVILGHLGFTLGQSASLAEHDNKHTSSSKTHQL